MIAFVAGLFVGFLLGVVVAGLFLSYTTDRP